MNEQTTPVIADANATIAELHQRAAADYANCWGQPDARALADDESSGDH